MSVAKKEYKRITVKSLVEMKKAGEKIEVMIYDLSGTVVFMKEPKTNGDISELEVDISRERSGIYYMVIKQGGASQTRKIEKN